MEAILETKAETILQFFRGLRGSLHVIFEGGTWSAWRHDLLKRHAEPARIKAIYRSWGVPCAGQQVYARLR